MGQFGILKTDPLGDAPSGGQPVPDATMLLRRLDALPTNDRQSRFVERLYSGIEYVQQTGSADTLEEHLERLDAVEYDQMSSGYALPRLVRATLPIVGMLGTVIGITLAIGQLSPDQLEESLTAVMAALSVAFDTTAQAMSLMLVLWFGMFGVEQVEQKLLLEIDRAVGKLLIGRFQQYGAATDPNVASVRRMGEQVIEAVEQVTAKQAHTWQLAIDATNEQWSEATLGASQQLTKTISEGLKESLHSHAEVLSQSTQDQAATITKAINEQLSKLSDATDEHRTRLSDSAIEQSDRLAADAHQLLSGLSDGLERMAELLVEALHRHGETLTQSEKELASENRRHLAEVEAALGEAMVVAADRQEKLVRQSESVLSEIQQALVSAAGASVEQQDQLIKQGEVLLKVVEATGQVRQLEETLSQNLEALSSTQSLDETLVGLSTSIQLLSARVGQPLNDQSSDHTAPDKAA